MEEYNFSMMNVKNTSIEILSNSDIEGEYVLMQEPNKQDYIDVLWGKN